MSGFADLFAVLGIWLSEPLAGGGAAPDGGIISDETIDGRPYRYQRLKFHHSEIVRAIEEALRRRGTKSREAVEEIVRRLPREAPQETSEEDLSSFYNRMASGILPEVNRVLAVEKDPAFGVTGFSEGDDEEALYLILMAA